MVSNISDTNNLQVIRSFQVFLSNANDFANNYIVSSNHSYLIMIIIYYIFSIKYSCQIAISVF